MPEKVEWIASIDRIIIELQNVSLEFQWMFPQPKFPEDVRKYENNGGDIYLNAVT